MKDSNYWKKYDKRTRLITYVSLVINIISIIAILGFIIYSKAIKAIKAIITPIIATIRLNIAILRVSLCLLVLIYLDILLSLIQLFF